ncbi:MAG: lipase family protein [Alcanivoracaceae bacterium]|nr:lipase family protein [Alcanivoracaceae bacterium]
MLEKTVQRGIKAMQSVSAIALLTLMPISASADEALDAFYNLPEPMPAGIPGTILRSEPMSSGATSLSGSVSKAYRVMYHSTDAIGNPNLVTGTIIVPTLQDSSSTKKIVVLAPGTAGPAYRCAPSIMIGRGAYYEQPAVTEMVKQGYIVAVTDYDGYQPTPKTSYIVGKAMGAAVLDIARATAEKIDADINNVRVALRGYSQGGGATMWAAQMQPAYAPEMNLVGAAAGGVPANLAQVALPLEGKDGFGVLFYALLGQDNAYPELSLDPFLNDRGRTTVSNMESDSCIIELLQDFSGLKLADLTDINPLNLDRFNRIAENELGKMPVNIPVFQYHEVQDGLVAYGQAKDLRNTYCAAGVVHTWKEYDTQGESGVIRHINLVQRGNNDVMAFLNARFNNVPATSNCPE